jgi:hypothetical protein
MIRKLIVLGIAHQIQGKNFPGYVDDPAYKDLVQEYIGLVDFVFEEATGNGPSIAEDCAKPHSGPRRYLDVDPCPKDRTALGIAECTSFAPCHPEFSKHVPPHSGELIDEHLKREKLWLDRIQAVNFEKALFICGIAHSFSFACRLKRAGFGVEVYHYLPFEKLCGRQHL